MVIVVMVIVVMVIVEQIVGDSSDGDSSDGDCIVMTSNTVKPGHMVPGFLREAVHFLEVTQKQAFRNTIVSFIRGYCSGDNGDSGADKWCS